MPERPLLILPVPGEPDARIKKSVPPARLHLPTIERQEERLSPKLTSISQALEAKRVRLRAEAGGLTSEEVLVLETIGPVTDFIAAVRRVEGLEWLGEIEEEDIPPDDDFFVPSLESGTRTDKPINGRMFLVFTNQRALAQIQSLWKAWLKRQALPRGFSKWKDLFSKLRDIRPWGVRDRLHETGILKDWGDRLDHGQTIVPCEIELWFRPGAQSRTACRDRVVSLVREFQGELVSETLIQEIAYHALLINLPSDSVRPLLNGPGNDIAIVQCEQVQFFRATGQMSGAIGGDERFEDPVQMIAPPATLERPVVALLDGLPLQNHHRLIGRLVVDDPDNFESEYPASERRHGTAMASLIQHGDINAGEAPLNRLLYVRPILRPDHRDWINHEEVVPDGILITDLIHRSVIRMFEAENGSPPVAPDVKVINLSIGIRDRLFDNSLSPLARLLDWLAWKYQVLFIVSAGNHVRTVELSVPRDQLGELSAEELQTSVVNAVAGDTRNRRLLSPAESINALSLAALHSDAATTPAPVRTIQAYVGQELPSAINAQGMGYRRSIKPDILLPGGRIIFRESLVPSPNGRLEVLCQQCAPGQCVAAPGSVAGDLSSTWHTRGTSNATALASRVASTLCDALDELRDLPGGDLLDAVPRSIWLKALLVHGASWGQAGEILARILHTQRNGREFKEYMTRLLGYGVLNPSRIQECTKHRVTALSGGTLQADKTNLHKLPLPPSLSGRTILRRLVVTLAWLTPINPLHHAWRRAALKFSPSLDCLKLHRQEADWQAVMRGTVQHEVMEGAKAAAFVDGDNLEILVSCRPDAGTLDEAIPYALAVTLEVSPEIGVDIYEEIRMRIPARVAVAPAG